MNICINTSSFPAFEGDYSGSFVMELAVSLKERGHNVYVLCPARQIAMPPEINGIKIIRYRYAFPARYQCIGGAKPAVPMIKENKLMLLFIPFYMLLQFLCLLKLIWQHKIDLVNSHWIIPQGIISSAACMLTGTKHVMTMHSTDVYLAAKLPLAGFFCRWADKRAKAVFIVSSFVKERYEKILKRDSKAIIMPMGVSNKKFKAAHAENRFLNNILFVGRLHKIKGIRYLIEAISICADKNHAVQLEIVGSGEEKDSLKQLAAKLNLENKVFFRGFVPNNKLAEYYRNAGCIIVSSLQLPSGETEGMPVVILEAMACGTPVLASNVGGIADIVKDGFNGFLFESGSSEAIAAAIQKFSESDFSKLSNNALLTASKYFWPEIAAEYERSVIEK